MKPVSAPVAVWTISQDSMMRTFLLLLVVLLAASGGSFAEEQGPKSTDPRVVIELFAEQPQLVTPTGLAIDENGRVFVAESHTHFRPDNYDGPKADRILILEDKDGDGQADARTIFHEGFTHIMDLAFHHDGSLYVATRKDIHRMRDTDGDDKADEVKRIINLDTKGDYPHNGISGLAFHLDGRLSFGLGENLGADYTISGTDGQNFTGGGEGGSTYQVNADGTHLRRVSTGWWNPFGMCVDAFDRVFGTDNDPGASPPCRLLQVIEGGDYGYEYRYGRTGLHPLISWTGSNPGNLPMISGTGEAPCAVLAYESDALPEDYLGRLLVASWADHRIEHYKITQPKDQGLVTTKREVLIEAQNEFRPVDLAVAPDGTVYVTDWVSSSYTLHKLGRIWRIRAKDIKPAKRPNDPEQALASLHRPLREQAAKALVDNLKISDTIPETLAKYDSPRIRAAIIQAIAANPKISLQGLHEWLAKEPDARVQQLGVRILGERMQQAGFLKWQKELQQRKLKENIDLDSPEIRKEAMKRLIVDESLRVDFSDWKTPSLLGVRAMAILSGATMLEGKDIKAWRKSRDPLLLHAIVIAQMGGNVNPASIEPEVNRSFNRDDGWYFGILGAKRLKDSPGMTAEMRKEMLTESLANSHSGIRFVAIKWIADEELKDFRPNLVKLLDDPKLDYRTFRAVAAAIDRLDGKQPADHPSPQFLQERLTAESTTPALLKVALREIDPGYKKLQMEQLVKLVSHADAGVQLEAIRTLAKHPDDGRFSVLLQIANDQKRPEEHRAWAIAGLADGPAEAVATLVELAAGEPGTLRTEAMRSLVAAKLDEKQLERLSDAKVDQQEMRRLFGQPVLPRPDANRLDDWQKLLTDQLGDPAAGERIFFGAKVGTCSRCHQINGRGIAVGPDLTQISRRLESQADAKTDWLLKTILRPSEDMAPQYTPWIILTTDGQTLTGLPRRKGGDQESYLGIDGKEFTVKKPDIEFHRESDTSLMPENLLQQLTDQEIRDLFAFLMQPR